MQKLKLLFLFLVLPFSFLSSNENTRTQGFVDLLMSSRLFEAFEYYEKYEAEINAEDPHMGQTFHSAFKNVALNDYDTSIMYFNEIFENISIDDKYAIAEILFDFSFNAQRYGDVVSLCDVLVELLDNNNSPVVDEYKASNRIHLSQIKDLCFRLQQEDEMQIHFNDSSGAVVSFDQFDDVPMTLVQVNRKETRALFDTGFSFPLSMTRQTADSIGVRVISDEIIMSFNNIPTPISYGILDSLNIGNLTVYNSSVMIINTEKLDQEHFLDILDQIDWGIIIIGLPLMKQIGTITLDIDNDELILSAKEAVAKDNYNMLLYKGRLFLRAAINDVLHTGLIDTGSSRDEITLNNHLYNKYKGEFGVIKTSYTDTTFLITHKNIRSLGVFEHLEWNLLPNQFPVVDISEQSRIRLDTNNESEEYDAFYGFKFMQRFRKVVFDFNKMEFRYIMQ